VKLRIYKVFSFRFRNPQSFVSFQGFGDLIPQG